MDAIAETEGAKLGTTTSSFWRVSCWYRRSGVRKISCWQRWEATIGDRVFTKEFSVFWCLNHGLNKAHEYLGCQNLVILPDLHLIQRSTPQEVLGT